MKYRLEHDFLLVLSPKEEQEAYERMAQHGTWEGNWWTPSPANELYPLTRIAKEGFIMKEQAI